MSHAFGASLHDHSHDAGFATVSEWNKALHPLALRLLFRLKKGHMSAGLNRMCQETCFRLPMNKGHLNMEIYIMVRHNFDRITL